MGWEQKRFEKQNYVCDVQNIKSQAVLRPLLGSIVKVKIPGHKRHKKKHFSCCLEKTFFTIDYKISLVYEIGYIFMTSVDMFTL